MALNELLTVNTVMAERGAAELVCTQLPGGTLISSLLLQVAIFNKIIILLLY